MVVRDPSWTRDAEEQQRRADEQAEVDSSSIYPDTAKCVDLFAVIDDICSFHRRACEANHFDMELTQEFHDKFSSKTRELFTSFKTGHSFQDAYERVRRVFFATKKADRTFDVLYLLYLSMVVVNGDVISEKVLDHYKIGSAVMVKHMPFPANILCFKSFVEKHGGIDGRAYRVSMGSEESFVERVAHILREGVFYMPRDVGKVYDDDVITRDKMNLYVASIQRGADHQYLGDSRIPDGAVWEMPRFGSNWSNNLRQAYHAHGENYARFIENARPEN